MQSETLFFRFPDEAAMIAVARAISGNDTVTALPPDGWLGGIYYNIDVVGPEIDDAGEPTGRWLVNGLWHGSAGTLPAPLDAYRIYPATPDRVFG